MPNLSPASKDLVNLIRRHRLTYDTFRVACHAARQHTKLKPPKRGSKLPKLLTDEQLKAYMMAVGDSGNLQHEIMIKLLFYTGARNDELCSIRVSDIDLAGGKIFIDQGKGSKDRYVLFSDQFRSLLRAYLATVPENEYLFESSTRKTRYTTRRIHQIVSGYAEVVGFRVHPHLFRHQMITYLKSQGLDDAQVQLVSGHASRKTLERYTHMSLGDVKGDYQEAMRKVELP